MVLSILAAHHGFSQAAPVAADFDKLAWLQGQWNRLLLPAGRSGHERWIKLNGAEYKGWGITMKGPDTAFAEKLRIVVKDNHIFYVAETADNKAPVYFIMTAISASGFECTNATHDFPKKIIYRRRGNQVKATISGNGKSVDFMFEKQPPAR